MTGSSPVSRTKKEDMTKVMSSFLDSLAPLASPSGDWRCSGEVNSPCAKVLLRKTLVTAQKRRRPEGRLHAAFFAPFHHFTAEVNSAYDNSPLTLRINALLGAAGQKAGHPPATLLLLSKSQMLTLVCDFGKRGDFGAGFR